MISVFDVNIISRLSLQKTESRELTSISHFDSFSSGRLNLSYLMKRLLFPFLLDKKKMSSLLDMNSSTGDYTARDTAFLPEIFSL